MRWKWRVGNWHTEKNEFGVEIWKFVIDNRDKDVIINSVNKSRCTVSPEFRKVEWGEKPRERVTVMLPKWR